MSVVGEADGGPDHRGHGQAPGRRAVEHTVGEGDGPVNALDVALRKALEPHFPRLKEMRLVDFKVRVINDRAGTAARVRVVIESQDGDEVWGTVGVSENMIEASWMALVDAFDHKLAKDARAERPIRPGRGPGLSRDDPTSDSPASPDPPGRPDPPRPSGRSGRHDRRPAIL